MRHLALAAPSSNGRSPLAGMRAVTRHLAPAFATLLFASLAHGAGLSGEEPKLLPPDEAFRFSARALDARTLEARFDVTNGYYLYRDKVAFAVEPSGTNMGVPELPKGVRKHDEFFGDVEIYRGQVVVKLPVAGAAPGQEITLRADSQGCADAGICYPPQRQQIRLTVPAAGAGPGPIVEANRKKGWFN